MRCLVLLVGLFSLASGSLASSDVFEKLRAIPKGWSELRTPSPEARIHLRIALKRPNQELFEQKLLDVSTPDHPHYGQHLKRAELKELLKPIADSTDTVLSWLASSGVAASDIDNDGDWVHFYVSIAKANAMMSTDFLVYGNSIDKSEKIRTLKYSVPVEVAEQINMIQPTTRFGQIRAQRSNVFEVIPGPPVTSLKDHGTDSPTQDLNTTACNATITPDCLRALYKIEDYQADPNVGSRFGVCGYLKEYAKFDDLQTFFEKYATYAEGFNFTYALINGGKDTQNNLTLDDGEGNLDIQYASSLAYNTAITYFSTGGLGELDPDLDEPTQAANGNEPYLDFLHYILKQDKVPQTLTTSYGEDEQSVPEKYAREVCQLFGQLGARGVSILFSSGDTGCGSACLTNDGKNTTRFLPTFPAACPYVTSVGATRYVEPEQAAYFSSGGFSDYWPRPSWQNQAIGEYLGILGDRWKGLYNPVGRGFPDVAAQGVHFHVIDKNGGTVQQDLQYSGTSCAGPTFAAIIALLNNARMSLGHPPLGFLNPWIYSTGRYALNDITEGGSTGCTGVDEYTNLTAPFVPYASWNATCGWDPVTGYGTPNFKKLLNQVAPGATWRSIGQSGTKAA